MIYRYGYGFVGSWMRAGLALVAGIGLFRSLEAFAGSAIWTTGGPYGGGGMVSAVVIDPQSPSTLYAAFASAGVFRSTDRGSTWAASNTGVDSLHVSALAIDPMTPSNLYAAAGGGILRSTDHGSTWSTPIAQHHEIRTLAVDSTEPSHLYWSWSDEGCWHDYCWTASGIDRSTDSGVTWRGTSYPRSSAPWSIVIDPRDHSIYAADVVGVSKSTDSGGTWFPANVGLAGVSVSVLAIDPGTQGGLYAGSGKGVFKSTDAGGSWVELHMGATPPSVTALAVNPRTPSVLYAGTNGAVFMSTDSGGSWSSSNVGLTGSIVEVLAIDPVSPTVLYAGTNLGSVLRSTDAGVTWSSPILIGTVPADVWSLAIGPSTPSVVYAGTSGSGVLRSTDSGGSWSLTGPTPGSPYATHRIVVDPVTPSTLYAGDDWGLLKSTDSGGTWTTLLPGATSVQSLVIDRYAATKGGVFRSTDSGRVWSFVGTGLRESAAVAALALDATGTTTLYAGLGDGVWQVTDPRPSFVVVVPVVLSNAGIGDSFYTSELALSNSGDAPLLLFFTYTSALGGWTASASDALAGGQQKIVPDAIEYLHELGIPVGESGPRRGTLRIDFAGRGAATVRTATAVPGGRAGVAYVGVPSSRLLSDPVYVCGLRQNALDRSNLAVVNAGDASDGSITLRLTVDPNNAGALTLPDIALDPGTFKQISGVLSAGVQTSRSG